MKNLKNMLLALALTAAVGAPAIAQNDPQNYQAPPSFAPQQLDSLVSRVALYPDPLLAQVLAAATFPDQIQDAARWANDNRNMRGDELANAISQSNLPFDPAVQALLPFPNVLDTMAQDMNWTSNLGNAFLAQRSDVMDAVQRMRRTAEQYGYLQSNNQMRVVSDASGVEIYPYDPGMVYVPVYDPYVVYAAPRPGFYLGSAIRFGGGYRLGASFGFWGGGFNWYNHAVVVNHTPWQRTWNNRETFVNRNVTVNRVNVDRNYNTYNRGDSYRAPQQQYTAPRYSAPQQYSAPQNRSYERQAQPVQQQSYRQQVQQPQQSFRQPVQQQQQTFRQPERQSFRPAENSHVERGGGSRQHDRR